MALDNPINAWLQMADARNRNRQQTSQDIGSIGQSLGQGFNTIGQAMQEQKKKQVLAQLVQAMQQKGQPIPGPQGYMPPGAGPSAKPAGQPIDNSGQIQALMMQYDPQTAMSRMPTPLQQSEISKNNAMADKYRTGGGGKPTGTIYRHSVTGEMTDDPNAAVGPEWKPYKTSQGDVLNKLSSQTAGKERNKAMTQRAEAWQRSIDVRQIDVLAKNTGITPKQQSALQQNNLRADRAIQVLSKPNLTWQELALGEVDLAGIMQGGVPHVDEVKNVHFPGWQQQWATWQTYANGHPTENVPEPIRKKVLDLTRGVIEIDNRFLHANALFQKQMIGPTIRGGIGQFEKPINEMTGVLTTQPSGAGGAGQEDPLGIR